ncbi:MAG: B12-binding domain-containing radical SAM protein [Bacteroidetes bacterium]|nr:B12-binding domain-containing radical SAM protein [Bacteroidota bacterium]
MNKKIILTTLNARYAHASLSLRYLYANLNELKPHCTILEFVINDNIYEMAENILEYKPTIVGIGVYIWNAVEVQKLVSILKKISPETKIILGGPEVSHFPHRVNFDDADVIIQGEAEMTFYNLCRNILDSGVIERKIIKSEHVDFNQIELPYSYYTDKDIATRVIYVEASRGCPFKCEFCLSSIDKSVRNLDIEIFLNQLDHLWQRGARKFKFIDRTFNLNINVTNKILDYFLEKEPPYFVHFEVIPDHFPESLKEKLKRFPPASLQLEIGIQTLNPAIAEKIERKLDFEKIRENLIFLQNETDAHLHLDLIIGLPAESIESFASNLNILAKLTSSEIQLGVLKKLSGTTLSRHDQIYEMIYSDTPPYEILQNNLLPFGLVQKMKRFARFWDLTYNSGEFKKSIVLLWPDGDVFGGFYKFSEWIFITTQTTWQISLTRLSELLFNYLTENLGMDKTEIANAISGDIMKIQGRKLPMVIRENMSVSNNIEQKKITILNKRQIKHL